ncbi:MAG TPA: hypothetical protein VF616_09835 [Duganella sp.]|uniref:hypothetical protein n=1 Tax=Duganella sp. TaxID=1904440 RepID=UPI002ED55E4C
MQSQSIRIIGAVAALFASLPFWAGAHATPAQPKNSPAGQMPFGLYTVINLGPEPTAAVLNERGQAAFTSFPDRVSRFFDGDRLWPIGSLGGGATSVAGINDRGVVVGASATAAEAGDQAYAWTLAGGIRALPGALPSFAIDINERGEIVGGVASSDWADRAVRWNPDGGVTLLGPLLHVYSAGIAINNRGYATGYATDGSTPLHATFWDRAGVQTDLSPSATGSGVGQRINERNELAGVINDRPFDPWKGLFWSPATGTVRIDAGADFRLGDLNNRGEVVGSGWTGDTLKAIRWAPGHGVTRLAVESGVNSHALDINERGEIAGWTQRSTSEGNISRAVLWPSSTAMAVDLTTRLYRAPAGLVLQEALALNDNGTILARSNAGLVMLRPGLRGTDAPVLGPIVGLPVTVEAGQDLASTLNFVDNGWIQTHKASVDWGDGCASPAPTLTEFGGSGQVRLQHRFCATGYYSIKVLVTDSGGRATELQRDVFVEQPGLATLSGSGALSGGAASAGTRHQHAPLRFALWTPLDGAAAGAGVATGAPMVSFSGPFNFRGEAVTRATSTSENRARVEGTGRLDGRAGYHFVLEAVDGGAGGDRLRIRVTHVDAATGAEVVDYDNGATQPTVGADRTVVTDGRLTLRR